ncbi:hydroxymethylbilane synthase [Mariniluteicoccus flavus]
MTAGPSAARSAGEPVRIGARRSPLAVAQAEATAAALARLGIDAVLVGITTEGDTNRRHLTEIGGTGVFAMAVRDALHDGRIDIAVHSMKDLPTAPAEGLVIAAVPEREDVRDVLVGLALDDLADGTVIGTGSPRRQAQLEAYAAARGIAVEFRPVRGNVDTRLGLVRSGEVDATVLAAAGLRRLGRLDGLDVTHQVLEPGVLLPAASQGALAIEVSAANPRVRDLVARLDHAPTRARVEAERTFLRTLEAGCLAPVGVLATVRDAGDMKDDLTLDAVIGRTWGSDSSRPGDGVPLLRVSATGVAAAAAQLGTSLAQRALAEMGSQPPSTQW